VGINIEYDCTGETQLLLLGTHMIVAFFSLFAFAFPFHTFENCILLSFEMIFSICITTKQSSERCERVIKYKMGKENEILVHSYRSREQICQPSLGPYL